MKKKYIIPTSDALTMSPVQPLAAGSVRDLNTGVEMIYNGEGSSGPARSRYFDFAPETPEEETPKQQEWDDDEEEC